MCAPGSFLLHQRLLKANRPIFFLMDKNMLTESSQTPHHWLHCTVINLSFREARVELLPRQQHALLRDQLVNTTLAQTLELISGFNEEWDGWNCYSSSGRTAAVYRMLLFWSSSRLRRPLGSGILGEDRLRSNVAQMVLFIRQSGNPARPHSIQIPDSQPERASLVEGHLSAGFFWIWNLIQSMRTDLWSGHPNTYINIIP